MTKAELKAALGTLAAKHTVTIEKNGREWTYAPTVTECIPVNGMPGFAVSLPVNAVMTERTAIDTLIAMRKEFSRLAGADNTRKSKRLNSSGYWHMGRHNVDCVSSRHYSAA